MKLKLYKWTNGKRAILMPAYNHKEAVDKIRSVENGILARDVFKMPDDVLTEVLLDDSNFYNNKER